MLVKPELRQLDYYDYSEVKKFLNSVGKDLGKKFENNVFPNGLPVNDVCFNFTMHDRDIALVKASASMGWEHNQTVTFWLVLENEKDKPVGA